MSVRITDDGIIYCHNVRYNHRVVRNMIADNSFGNITGKIKNEDKVVATEVGNNLVWNRENVSIREYNVDGEKGGYKSFRVFKFESTYCKLYQSMPVLKLGHTYYLGFMYKCNFGQYDDLRVYFSRGTHSSSAGDKFNTPIDSSNSVWKRWSSVFSFSRFLEEDEDEEYQKNNPISLVLEKWKGMNYLYASRFILIDLDEAFPGQVSAKTASQWRDWCDTNIREWEVYQNFGNVSKNVSVNKSDQEKNYSFVRSDQEAVSPTRWGYLGLDSGWEPREYMYYLERTDFDGELRISANAGEGPYYSQMELMLPSGYPDCYISVAPNSPVALPLSSLITTFDSYNGGGGMHHWKRLGWFLKCNFSDFTTIKTETYPGFSFSSSKLETIKTVLRLTALQLVKVPANLEQYKLYNDVSVSVDDVNVSWCDRWIDGRSSPIIHIKDPFNTSIVFRTPKVFTYASMVDYTTSFLDDRIGTNWSYSFVSASSVSVGDIICVRYSVRSAVDLSKTTARLFVRVTSIENSRVSGTGLYWAYEDSFYESASGRNDSDPSDIICNDIEIRPELNSVSFDGTTGTIYCKKLVLSKPNDF